MILNRTHHSGYFNYKKYTLNKIINAVRGIAYGMSFVNDMMSSIMDIYDFDYINDDRPKTYEVKPLPIISKQNIKILKPSIKNKKLQRANLLKRVRR
jgi:hypothetical protein